MALSTQLQMRLIQETQNIAYQLIVLIKPSLLRISPIVVTYFRQEAEVYVRVHLLDKRLC